MRQRLTTLLGLAIVLSQLTSCAALPGTRPEPPVVSVANVRPLNLSLTAQKLEFRLRVVNPNPYDLPLQRLNFDARFAGEKIADGESNEEVTIPANGEAFVDVAVVAGISSLIDTFRTMIDAGALELNYDVAGTVKLANWPKTIPFDVEGNLLDTGTTPE